MTHPGRVILILRVTDNLIFLFNFFPTDTVPESKLKKLILSLREQPHTPLNEPYGGKLVWGEICVSPGKEKEANKIYLWSLQVADGRDKNTRNNWSPLGSRVVKWIPMIACNKSEKRVLLGHLHVIIDHSVFNIFLTPKIIVGPKNKN